MARRIRLALQKRRNKNDKFRLVNGYSWDYVMAFQIYDDEQSITSEQRTWNLKRIMAQLASGGLQIRLFYNTMHNVVYCKIRASQRRLMKEAVRTGMRLQLDETALNDYCRAGRPERGWGPLTIPDTSVMTKLAPFQYMTAPYQMNAEGTGTHADMLPLYKKWPMHQLALLAESNPISAVGAAAEPQPGAEQEAKRHLVGAEGAYVTEADGDVCQITSPESATPDNEGFTLIEHTSVFRMADRLKLIFSIINNNTTGGCHLNTDLLLKNNCMQDISPLHDHVGLRHLQNKWITLVQLPWNQETTLAKDYFGERIGLYFSWMGLYTSWLVVASIAGIAAYVQVQRDGNNPNSKVMPYFAGFMAIWGTLFLESWKRKEVRLAMEWGMDGYKTEEQDRPEFSGVKAQSPVTGKETKYFPAHMRTRRMFRSYGMVCCSLIVVIGTLALMIFVRTIMKMTPGITYYSSEISSVLIAMQIEILNYMFYGVAISLNDSENHRTDSEYEDALITKAFVFQFLNSFSCLFYISFLKPFLKADQCNPQFCFFELQATLGTIFMSRLFIHTYHKLIAPLVRTNRKLREVQNIDTGAVDADKHDVSEVETMFLMPEYDALMGTFNDYSLLVSQFGYMTMFISAFPLCTLLAFTNNYVQMRVDAWRLCQIVQRPDPKSTEKIGRWQNVMELIGIISVFTNSGLISFTGQFAISYPWALRTWIFFGMSAFIISVKWAFMAIIPDIPHAVLIQTKRNEYVIDKVLHNKADVQSKSDASTLRVRPNFKLRVGDDDPL